MIFTKLIEAAGIQHIYFICLGHELVQLLLSEHRPEHGADLLQLLHAYEAILITVEYFERLPAQHTIITIFRTIKETSNLPPHLLHLPSSSSW